MATLEELRVELDKIDNQMVELYQKRMNVCREVGDYKVKAGRKVYDRQREQEKLADVASKVENDFDKNGVRELYTQLMSMSRKLQYQKLVEAGALGRLPFIQIDSLEKDTARVVFQGTEGAYGEAAMHQFFGEDVNCFHVRTFRDAMTAIEEGAADYAVLPIENSSAGPVNEMYDLLDEFENYIVAETILPVVHTLSGLPGTSLTDIKRVYSKAEALMQTTGFLNDHADWQQIAESAAKQSKRMLVPEVHSVMTFKEALVYAKELDVLLIPYELAKGMKETKELIRSIEPGKSIGVFIGPEGGFEEQEVADAMEAGAKPITLGHRILRTETAGLAVLSVLMFQLEDE